jgi:hypothetical protein
MQVMSKQRITNKILWRPNQQNKAKQTQSKPISMKAFKNAFSAFGIWFYGYNSRRIIKETIYAKNCFNTDIDHSNGGGVRGTGIDDKYAAAGGGGNAQ